MLKFLIRPLSSSTMPEVWLEAWDRADAIKRFARLLQLEIMSTSEQSSGNVIYTEFKLGNGYSWIVFDCS